MKDHLLAVKALLAPLAVAPKTIQTYLVTAPPETMPPYVILIPLSPSAVLDEPLRPDQSLWLDLRLLHVAGTAEGVLDMLGFTRSLLRPNGEPVFPVVAGRKVELTFARFEGDPYPDPSVRIPTTSRNPVVAADTYSLNSQPTS